MDDKKINKRHVEKVLSVLKPHLVCDLTTEELYQDLYYMKFNAENDCRSWPCEVELYNQEKKWWKQIQKLIAKKSAHIRELRVQDGYWDRGGLLEGVLIDLEAMESRISDGINNDFWLINKTGKEEDIPFTSFVSGRCKKWFKYTGKRPTQYIEYETPFQNFVYASFDALEGKCNFRRKLTNTSIRDIVKFTNDITNFYKLK